jgi:hypothetical protein
MLHRRFAKARCRIRAKRFRVATLALFISSCATNNYMGVPLTAGAADPELQELASRAQAGDKHAQLELGIAFEEGRGVPRELKTAEKLYRLAARDSGGTMWVYSPPVGNGASGRVIPLRRGPRQAGLTEAQARLEALDGQTGLWN